MIVQQSVNNSKCLRKDVHEDSFKNYIKLIKLVLEVDANNFCLLNLRTWKKVLYLSE